MLLESLNIPLIKMSYEKKIYAIILNRLAQV